MENTGMSREMLEEVLRCAADTVEMAADVIRLARQREGVTADAACGGALGLAVHQLAMTADDLRTAADGDVPDMAVMRHE